MKSTILALALVLVVFAHHNDAIPINWIDAELQDGLTNLPFGEGQIDMPQVQGFTSCQYEFRECELDLKSQLVIVGGLNSIKTVTWNKESNSTHYINTCKFKVPKANVRFVLNSTGCSFTYLPYSGKAENLTGKVVVVKKKSDYGNVLAEFEINPVQFLYNDHSDIPFGNYIDYCIAKVLNDYGLRSDFTVTLANRLRPFIKTALAHGP